jgi:hypothetical protein
MKATPLRAIRTQIVRLLETIDHTVFREPDLDALACGWEVRRGRRLSRTYRDPRWDSITACPSCAGSSADGAHDCSTCAGAGTIRLALITAHRHPS